MIFLTMQGEWGNSGANAWDHCFAVGVYWVAKLHANGQSDGQSIILSLDYTSELGLVGFD